MYLVPSEKMRRRCRQELQFSSLSSTHHNGSNVRLTSSSQYKNGKKQVYDNLHESHCSVPHSVTTSSSRVPAPGQPLAARFLALQHIRYRHQHHTLHRRPTLRPSGKHWSLPRLPVLETTQGPTSYCLIDVLQQGLSWKGGGVKTDMKYMYLQV